MSIKNKYLKFPRILRAYAYLVKHIFLALYTFYELIKIRAYLLGFVKLIVLAKSLTWVAI